ncbi:MAG: MotA/TolQ/ExbB proton channel family protein [Planctomycetota bacterium]
MLTVYRRVIDAASTANRFEGSVQLTFENGRIEAADVLRLGLLCSFYSHDATGEAGFVNASPESEGKLVGRAVGLTDSQMSALDGFIAAPTEEALIPFDVTGGAGLASLQAADGIATWFEKGGKFMWPLLIVAVLAALIILERAVALTIRTRGIDAKITRMLDLVEAGKIEEAETKADKMGGAVGRVFHAALVHRDQDRSVMDDAVQEALLHETPSFQKRLAFVALCAAVAPLMGLLGTVTGMITTFKMVTIFGTSDPRFMAGGISEALITTQGGLYLAIPCLLCRGILGSMADGALGRLETGAMSAILVTLKHQEAERIREQSEEEVAGDVELTFDPEEGGEDVPLPISDRMTDSESLPESGVGSPGGR